MFWENFWANLLTGIILLLFGGGGGYFIRNKIKLVQKFKPRQNNKRGANIVINKFSGILVISGDDKIPAETSTISGSIPQKISKLNNE